jgi:hypothetical protein
MAYGQINYPQKVGNGPYTIAEIGCFLTAFCNLLSRFGEQIDPPALNNEFMQKGSYLLDPEDGPGVHDDLAWGSVSAHDGQVVVVGTGGPGWPDSNDAIVKFIYTSKRTGQHVTHFCLVQDHNAGTILDSWDGNVKASPYGVPVAWAKYERHQPQVVTPPAPQSTPAFTVQDIPEKTEELKIDTHIWDLNQRTWPGIVNNPVGSARAGDTFKTSQIAHHVLGGSYYLPEGSGTQGYNVVDCEDPQPAPNPAPAAPVVVPPAAPTSYSKNVIDGVTFETIDGAPKQYWISNPQGANKWSFKDVTNWRGFKSVAHLDYGTEVFISGVAHHPIPPTGADYYMTGDDFGDFKKTGKPANFYGFNWADISDKRPPVLQKPVPTPPVVAAVPTPPAPAVPTPTVTEPAASTAPLTWQDTYRPFPKAIHYIATRDLLVEELSGKKSAMPLPHYDPTISDKVGVVSSFGTVSKDGVDYYRLKTNNDPNYDYWYCVPKVDAATHTPNLLVMPANPLEPISKVSVARDTLELVKARIETDASQFLDDLVPSFLKKPKNKK